MESVMEMKEFQAKLTQVLKLAEEQEYNLRKQDVLNAFGENQLSAGQLSSLYEYLKVQGIRIEGQPLPDTISNEQEPEKTKQENTEKAHGRRKRIPLEDEDFHCLQQYQAYIKNCRPSKTGEKEELLLRWKAGDLSVIERLTDLYLPELLELAQDLYTSDVALGDLIQEGNMCLLITDQGQIPQAEADRWMQKRMAQAMQTWLDEQIDRKLQDESMVEKVRRLEMAIQELSDDGNPRFTVEELSAYLDMSVEQIQDILKLTGEENNGGS